MDEQADAAQLPAFVEALAAEILRAAVPEPEVGLFCSCTPMPYWCSTVWESVRSMGRSVRAAD